MAHNFTSSAVDELACPVCLLYYVPPYEPKNLPSCSHICCILCLKDLAKKEENKKELKCPQCNQVSKLPPTGVSGLPTILAMQNLAVKTSRGNKATERTHTEWPASTQNGQGENAQRVHWTEETVTRFCKEWNRSGWKVGGSCRKNKSKNWLNKSKPLLNPI